MIVMPTVANVTSTTRSGPTSQPESTAYSAAGEPRLSNCLTGPQPWTTASSTSAEQQERQQRPAQEHEAGAVQHGQKYDGVRTSIAGTGERRPRCDPVQSRVSRARGRPLALTDVIDPRILRDQPDRVRAAQAKRGLSDAVVDEALAADARRRQAIADFEAKRAEQKTLGKQIPQAQGEEKQALLARTKDAGRRGEGRRGRPDRGRGGLAGRGALDPQPRPRRGAGRRRGRLRRARDGRHAARLRSRGFEPRDHVELGRMLGAIDIERGAKVSGSRFYFLTGVGAQLELALVNLAMEQARDAGFTQVIAPSLVRPRAMEGTGFLGQAADDVYRIEGEDLYLVGTSEVPMAAYHSDEILDAASLPLRYAAFSPCFRKEAGSHGKDTKGIIRVHWFDKVEMFVYTTIEESDAEHQRLLAWEKEFLDKLELAYRVIDTAAGDLGLSAVRKFDCEAWIPTQGRYRELTSTSNCTEFQTRRLDIRGRFPPTGHRRRSRRSTARCARCTAHDRGDPRDPPEGRRLGHRPAGAAAAHGRRSRSSSRCQ